MRYQRTRGDDSTFQLNLAPMLDVIMSVTPMLLLSIAFFQVNVIESPLPQAVNNAIQEQKNKKEITIELQIQKSAGLKFIINNAGKKTETAIALKAGAFDLERLKQEAKSIKAVYPHIFHVDLKPDHKTSLDELVQIMDAIRKLSPKDNKYTFVDPKTGQRSETDFIFPDTVFANVMGE